MFHAKGARQQAIRLLLILGLASVAAALVPGYIAAQEHHKPAQPAAEKPSSLEAKARVFEGKGLYAQAVNAYKDALYAALELAGKAAGEESRRWNAEAEIYLDRAVSLMYQQPAPDYEKLCEFLEQVATDFDLPGVLDGWRRWHLAGAQIRTGQLDEVRDACRRLGFVTDWMVTGPFQNERGGYFKVSYGPEKEIDLNAAYDGKKRKVRWRLLPVRPLLADVDFDSLMRPNDEVLAYALAYVSVPQETEAALRIASDEGLMVWVNDQKVLEQEIHRTLGFDQDVVAVKLNAGLNKILVKVSERNGNWAFRLRITDPQGGEVAFKAAQTREEFLNASYKQATDPAAFVADRGAIGYYEKRVSQEPEDVIAQAHYGYLHLVHPFEDENAYKDQTAFEKCIELVPDNPYYHFMLCEAHFYKRTRMQAEKESNKGRQMCEKAIELEGQYVEALLHMARYYLQDMNNWHKAKTYLDRALKVNGEYLPALLLHLDILEARGFHTEVKLATLALEKHARQEIRRSPSLRRRLTTIYQDGKPAKALEIVRDMLRQDYSDVGARYQLASHFRETGKMQEALAQYETLSSLDPYQIRYPVRRCAIYLSCDELEKAVAEIDKALAVCPEAEDELVKRGNLLMRLSLEAGEDMTGEIYAEAMAVFELARRINPNNAWLKRYLEFLQEKKKSYEELERFASLVEVKPDDGVYIKSRRLVSPAGATRLDEQGNPILEEGQPKTEEVITRFATSELTAQAKKENLSFICILSRQITNVHKDGTASEFTHFVVKIFNEEGIDTFKSFSAGPFLTSYGQNVKIKKASVLHEDGSQEEGRSFESGVLFPPLAVGDVLDVQFRIDDQATDLTERFFGDYYGDTHIFHNSIYLGEIAPIKRHEYYLILPKDRKFYFNYINTEARPVKEPGITDETEMYAWKMRDLPHIVPEAFMPPLDQFLPAVQVSTFGDWGEFGKWFYNLLKKQYDTSPEIEKKVQELTADKKTELEKIKAIYNFVVTDVTYEAWEYGIHGWQPYKASTIFARKFGDCKDKALLINTMLNEAGIKGLPVLIYATRRRGKPDMSLPMIRHFNHCIAYVPPSGERKKGLWLDGTAQFYGLTDGPPFMDWGAPVLVVNEDGGQILSVPLPNIEKTVQTENTVIEILKNGNAKTKTTLTVSGDNAAISRQSFAVEGRRNFQLERMYGSFFGGARALSTEFPDLTDLNVESLSYSFELEIPDFVKKTSEGLALPHEFFPIPWSQLAPQSERKYAYVLPCFFLPMPVLPPLPGTLKVSLSFILPEKFTVVSLPDKQEFSSEFADFKLSFKKVETVKGGCATAGVEVTRTISFKQNNLSVQQYGQFRELMNLLVKSQKDKIIIQAPEAPPEPEEKKEPQEKEKPADSPDEKEADK